jgi:uncharacterized protein YjiS (DUF1127 family)
MRDAAQFIASQTRPLQAGILPALRDGAIALLRAFLNRRRLLRLTELDDHLLRDIGLSRQDLRVALDLPFGEDPALELQRLARRSRSRGWRD